MRFKPTLSCFTDRTGFSCCLVLSVCTTVTCQDSMPSSSTFVFQEKEEPCMGRTKELYFILYIFHLKTWLMEAVSNPHRHSFSALPNTAIDAWFLEFRCGWSVVNTAELLPQPAKGQLRVLIFTIRMFLKGSLYLVLWKHAVSSSIKCWHW